MQLGNEEVKRCVYIDTTVRFALKCQAHGTRVAGTKTPCCRAIRYQRQAKTFWYEKDKNSDRRRKWGRGAYASSKLDTHTQQLQNL